MGNRLKKTRQYLILPTQVSTCSRSWLVMLCFTLGAFAMMLLTGCASTYQVYGGTHSLAALKKLRVQTGERPASYINPIRLAALKEVAVGVGAQSGLAYRANQIDDILDSNDRHLRQVFDFNQMLMSHNVLPPVLSSSRDNLHLAGTQALRLADRTYTIIKQARFVTAAPSWRQYLWMDFAYPERPNSTLLPKNKYEQKRWTAFIEQGWAEGIIQANTIYHENLARLKRDYAGMALYKQLLAQGMVSAPFVAHTDLGVTGNSNNIRINDQVLRITALPKLNVDSARWRPVLTR